ncbi:MFS transporter [Chitinasiproducens palmae]|uniref:Nitrate/nitrite transporter NarK n=1 Tax=Chitinasiproducens palmae TaxID=1770053 RepID=A0A1H2PLK1_9BURK|nr:MFS transporter [Chitinasiproducens palmae]SDV47261.1 Nitrate/nitrite transporter NarK [Chitinasiproducens palmae]
MSLTAPVEERSSQSLPHASAIQQIYAKVFWRFIPLLVICWVIAYLDRVNISFAKLQMQSELGLSDAVYGFGASVFFIGYFLFEVPSNMVLHRVGARVWIMRIMVTWGIASACMMFIKSEVGFYVIRFLVGSLEAGFVPGVLYFFTKWFPADRRARINTIFMSGIAFCGIIGGPISGGIMKFADGGLGLSGWQWLFLLEGIPSVILGLIVWRYLDDEVKDATWLTEDEKAMWASQVATDARAAEAHNFAAALREPATYTLSLIYLCLAGGIYGLVFWVPQLIKTAGTQDTFVIGLISALPYLVAGISMILLGRSSDRRGERRWHLALTTLAGGVGYFISGFYSSHSVALLVGLIIAATGIISAIGLFWVFPQRFLGGAAAAGGIALINAVGQLGGIISPYMVGKVKVLTGSATLGLYAIAVSCVLAFVLAAWGLPKRFYLRN